MIQSGIARPSLRAVTASGSGYRPAVLPERGGPSPKDEAPVDERFSVDGTLIQAWTSMKRLRPQRRQRLRTRSQVQ